MLFIKKKKTGLKKKTGAEQGIFDRQMADSYNQSCFSAIFNRLQSRDFIITKNYLSYSD